MMCILCYYRFRLNLFLKKRVQSISSKLWGDRYFKAISFTAIGTVTVYRNLQLEKFVMSLKLSLFMNTFWVGASLFSFNRQFKICDKDPEGKSSDVTNISNLTLVSGPLDRLVNRQRKTCLDKWRQRP